MAAKLTERWVKNLLATADSYDPQLLLSQLSKGELKNTVAAPPTSWSDPWLIGQVHELCVSSANRSARGAWYTPKFVVQGLVRFAFDLIDFDPKLIVDPTCGGGAFLLASLDELVERGVLPSDAIQRVRGMDIDAGAAHASRLSLNKWAANHSCEESVNPNSILVGDALFDMPKEWRSQRLVVGNPPFASPLKSETYSPAAASYRENHDDVFRQYSDLASLHLYEATKSSATGSLVMMVQPQSVLATKHLSKWREKLDDLGPLVGMWVSDRNVFKASVRTCATVHKIGATRHDVALAGPELISDAKELTAKSSVYAASPYNSWSSLACDAIGTPPASINSSGKLSNIASATAGFRDEYYGLAEVCEEAPVPTECSTRLHTVGLIGILNSQWGTETATFNKQRWTNPSVPAVEASEKIAKWIKRHQVSKILLATQSKVLKPYVDLQGNAVGVTPLILVESETLFHTAAVLLSPVVSLIAFRSRFGSALSIGAIKLSAKEVLDLPLPANQVMWDEGAFLVEKLVQANRAPTKSQLKLLAATMNRAYDASNESLEWWLNRI